MNNELVANCDRFKTLKHSTSLCYAFTEQGVAMLSAVLHSETAIQVSIKIMNAFVQLRHYVSEHVLKTDDKADTLDYIKMKASKNVQIARVCEKISVKTE